ncbi:MarR family transcriptional regulator [Acidimicrobiaceae bacterium AH-315-P05]|nr:MarR family transcriptional regulator [Acidimicrobiaceae bacterium AH-315-P05]
MTEPHWLNATQQQAWQGLLVIFLRAMPELERTFKANELLGVQYGILVALAEEPNSTLRLTDLADLANTSQSRLTHRLRNLVSRGDIEITEDSQDRRAKNATLTKAGKRRLDAVAPKHVEDVKRLIFDHLNQDQTVALADALSTIAASLCDHSHFQPEPRG